MRTCVAAIRANEDHDQVLGALESVERIVHAQPPGLDAEAHPITWTHRGPVDELWDGAAAGIGGIGATVAAQPVEVRERLRAAYDQEVRALVVDGELCFSTEAVLGVGVAPGRMGA